MIATPLRAIIFDLDGTLYDNRRLKWLLPLAESLTFRLGYLYRERQARRRLHGQHFDTEQAFYAQLFQAISPRHPERARRWYHHHYMPLQVWLLRHCCRRYPWVLTQLDALRAQGLQLVLYSDYGSASDKLTALGIPTQAFTLIADAPSLGGLKPHPTSTQRLLQQLGLQPHEVLVVGDRPDTDVAAAQAIGARYYLIDKDQTPCFSTHLATAR